MHFMVLAFVEISQVQKNKEIKQKLEELILQKQFGKGNIMQDIMIEKYRSLQTEFSCALILGISNMMYPYWMSTGDPNYMEFYDKTDWLREKYNDGIDCIKLSQGTIVEQGGDPIGDCLLIHNENMSFKEFAEKICGAIFDENHQGYGYYYNPNAMYDYYSIGGRWSHMFLVKETCTEYFVGRRSQSKPDIEQEKRI